MSHVPNTCKKRTVEPTLGNPTQNNKENALPTSNDNDAFDDLSEFLKSLDIVPPHNASLSSLSSKSEIDDMFLDLYALITNNTSDDFICASSTTATSLPLTSTNPQNTQPTATTAMSNISTQPSFKKVIDIASLSGEVNLAEALDDSYALPPLVLSSSLTDITEDLDYLPSPGLLTSATLTPDSRLSHHTALPTYPSFPELFRPTLIPPFVPCTPPPSTFIPPLTAPSGHPSATPIDALIAARSLITYINTITQSFTLSPKNPISPPNWTFEELTVTIDDITAYNNHVDAHNAKKYLEIADQQETKTPSGYFGPFNESKNLKSPADDFMMKLLPKIDKKKYSPPESDFKASELNLSSEPSYDHKGSRQSIFFSPETQMELLDAALKSFHAHNGLDDSDKDIEEVGPDGLYPYERRVILAFKLSNLKKKHDANMTSRESEEWKRVYSTHIAELNQVRASAALAQSIADNIDKFHKQQSSATGMVNFYKLQYPLQPSIEYFVKQTIAALPVNAIEDVQRHITAFPPELLTGVPEYLPTAANFEYSADNNTCPICHIDIFHRPYDPSLEWDPEEDVVVFSCHHSMHKSCAYEALGSTNDCPYCRTPILLLAGPQPAGGTLDILIEKPTENDSYGSITLIIDFPAGKQDNRHPHPNAKYGEYCAPITMVACPQAFKLLKLYVKAFMTLRLYKLSVDKAKGADPITPAFVSLTNIARAHHDNTTLWENAFQELQNAGIDEQWL